MTTKQTFGGTTTVKRAAVHWLDSKFGDTGNIVKASKLHILQSLWWIDIPKKDIETPQSNEIDLLCQATPKSNKFYYLKVPVEFFKKEKLKLDVNDKGILRLHLSAEPEEMFIDRRGVGKIGFSSFLQTRYRKK